MSRDLGTSNEAAAGAYDRAHADHDTDPIDHNPIDRMHGTELTGEWLDAYNTWKAGNR